MTSTQPLPFTVAFRRKLRRIALAALLAIASTDCASERGRGGSNPQAAFDASNPPNPAHLDDAGPASDAARGGGFDCDGVQMLFPPAPGGTSWCLGSQDPNTAPGLVIETGVVARAMTENGIHFWNTATYPIQYSSGSTGQTGRWHIHASGGTQLYTWLTQRGYLSTPADLKNQEMTAYVRAHQFVDLSHAGVTLKVRGGLHSTSDGNLASCVMMELCPTQRSHITRFGKELVHPNYDYVTLPPMVSTSLVDGQWVGLKLVSYNVSSDATRVINRLYVDTAPFDASARPQNDWQLMSEYVDVEGASTGTYTKLANWGGWQTTLRVDGMQSYDVAILSVREIAPP
jgi:hypothetical protein